MHSEKNGRKYIADLRTEGYHVAGAFVDVSTAMSLKSALGRHRHGQDRFNQGIGRGGRVVPDRLIVNAGDPSGVFRSINRAAFETLKGERAFDQTVTIDNENYAAKLIGESGRDGVGRGPLPHPAVVDANGQRLRVRDVVRHVLADPATAVTGTVEHTPERGDSDDDLKVYWTGHGAGYRSNHPAADLVKTGAVPGAGRVPAPQVRTYELPLAYPARIDRGQDHNPNARSSMPEPDRAKRRLEVLLHNAPG